MKLIYLVRHAKSSWNNPGQPDFDRPLNKRGLLDAPVMGQSIQQQGFLPDLIISSPANRALSTAKIMANSLSYPLENIAEQPKFYDANVDELLAEVQQLDDVLHNLLLIGHNPSMSWFADFLCDDPTINLPTCGVYAIECHVQHWSEIAKKCGKCILFDFPSNHIQD